MPKFEVTTKTVYRFEAPDAFQAEWLVENGEMPRDHEVVDTRVDRVERVE